MPNFTWDISPIAYAFPRDTLLLTVSIIAGLMLVYSLIRKQSDLSIFSVFLFILAAIGSKFLPEEVGLRYYSLLYVCVFLGGYGLLNWQIRRGGGDEETAGDFIVYGVLAVLLGARLGHVLFYDLDKAIQDPLWVLQIWTGGLASHGAVIGLIIAMWLFTKRRGVSFFEGADRFAFSAALGATLVRLGNFFNSEIVGRVVDDQSWGVRFTRCVYDRHLPIAPLRYPTQLFEFFLGLFVLLCLYLVDRATGREKRPRGLMISVFFLVYFAGRFIVEFWKEYQTLDAMSALTMGQVLSIPPFLIGVIGVVWSLKAKIPVGWPATKKESPEQEDSQAESPASSERAIDEDVDAVLNEREDSEEAALKSDPQTEEQDKES